MSKYDRSLQYYEEEPNIQLMPGESIIWSGKPKKSAYIINKLALRFPFVILWLFFDLVFIFTLGMKPLTNSGMLFFIIMFFGMHLLPVWIWIADAVTASRKWKKTKYYVTDKRIIIQNGFIAENYQTIYYKDIKNVNLHIGVIDKLLGVGDINFSFGTTININNNTNSNVNYNFNYSTAFLDVEDYKELFPKVQKIILDIQSDIEYPNQFRPENNPGYNTKYNP